MGRAQLFRAARRLWVLGVALAVSGCGSDNVVPVSGRVTLDGQPAANVRVTFQPLGSAENPNPGPGSYAVTDADGRYQLTLVGTKRLGAVVGKHRVSIKSSNGPNDEFPDAPPKPAKVVAKEYNKESTLEFDVRPGGTTTADFAVTSEKGSSQRRTSR
jgi:hypothetical protein